MSAVRAVLFDYGNVLVRWAPENLYRKLIPDEAARARFLTEICPLSWHLQHDAGSPMAETLPVRAALYPEHADLIHAWGARYGEMIDGEIAGAIAVLDELAAANVPMAMLTNMPADKTDQCFAQFTRRALFDPIIVSGEHKMVKPDHRLYALTLNAMQRQAHEVLFVDDSETNIAGAAECGLHTHHFTTPEAMRLAFVYAGLLPA